MNKHPQWRDAARRRKAAGRPSLSAGSRGKHHGHRAFDQCRTIAAPRDGVSRIPGLCNFTPPARRRL